MKALGLVTGILLATACGSGGLGPSGMDRSDCGMTAAVRRLARGRWWECGPARRLGRLDTGLDEAVAQELLGVAEGETPRLGAHHDQEEALARPPRRDGEVVARLAREARLQRLHAARILEERDAPG